MVKNEVRERTTPLPSPSLSLPPSPPLPFSSVPPLPRSGPLKPAMGAGVALKAQQWGPGQSPDRKRTLVYFELENCICRQHFWLFI